MGVRVLSISINACSRAMMRSTTWSAVVTVGNLAVCVEERATSDGEEESAGAAAVEGAAVGAAAAVDTAAAAWAVISCVPWAETSCAEAATVTNNSNANIDNIRRM